MVIKMLSAMARRIKWNFGIGLRTSERRSRSLTGNQWVLLPATSSSQRESPLGVMRAVRNAQRKIFFPKEVQS